MIIINFHIKINTSLLVVLNWIELKEAYLVESTSINNVTLKYSLEINVSYSL